MMAYLFKMYFIKALEIETTLNHYVNNIITDFHIKEVEISNASFVSLVSAGGDRRRREVHGRVSSMFLF